MNLTYKYKLMPSKIQRTELEKYLDVTNNIYNICLEQRITQYKLSKQVFSKDEKIKHIDLADQYSEIPALRKELDLDLQKYPNVMLRWPMKKLDLAFQAFFKRVSNKKNGSSEKAGFPRFRSRNRAKTFGFTEFSGVVLKTKNNTTRLHIYKFLQAIYDSDTNQNKKKKISDRHTGIMVNMHRDLPKDHEITNCVLTKKADKWYVCLSFKVPDITPIKFNKKLVKGVDWGREHALTFDDGTTLETLRVEERYRKKIEKAQRKVSRAQKGSIHRKKCISQLGRIKNKEANARNTHLHQLSAEAIKISPFLALEDLQVKKMTKSADVINKQNDTTVNTTQKTSLNKSVLDGAPHKLKRLIQYKAEKAGGRCVLVNPKYTSQTCSRCFNIAKKELNERMHHCSHCGLKMHRDKNAARNILRIGSPLFLIPKPQRIVKSWGKVVKDTAKKDATNVGLEISKNCITAVPGGVVVPVDQLKSINLVLHQ